MSDVVLNNDLVDNENSPFSFTYAGWTITTPPPPVTGKQQFAPSPSPLVHLEAANATWIDPQSVTPDNPQSENLSATGSYVVDGCWATYDDNQRSPLQTVTATLTLPTVPDVYYSAAIQLDLTLFNIPGYGAEPGNYYVLVNDVAIKNPETQSSEFIIPAGLTSPFVQEIHIPGDILTEGENQLYISTNPYPSAPEGVCILKISAQTAPINISAKARWKAIGSGFIPEKGTYSETLTVTQGNTSTSSETKSFGEEFGFSSTISATDLLSSISLTMSASFSEDESSEHSVSIEKETSVSYGPDIGPAPKEGLTFQIWALEVVFQANDREIIQALGVNGPIITQQYPSKFDDSAQR